MKEFEVINTLSETLYPNVDMSERDTCKWKTNIIPSMQTMAIILNKSPSMQLLKAVESNFQMVAVVSTIVILENVEMIVTIARFITCARHERWW